MKAFCPVTEDISWMERLRPGHFIFLCKEQRYAQVELPWFPPQPGSITGKLTFRVITQLNPRIYVSTECWFVFPDGKGFDRSQLILPVENNLPSFPEPIEHRSMIELRYQIARLQSEVDQLKQQLQELLP